MQGRSRSDVMVRMAALCCLCIGSISCAAESADPAQCERDSVSRSGQSGKDVIWLPTEMEIVQAMLKLAQVRSDDIVYDLGAGDGRIVIEAARAYGVRGVGIEYNPDLVKRARCLAQAAGVADKAQFMEGDIFATDFSAATVLTLYLLPSLNQQLMPTILKMRPGTRVVSHSFLMGDWEPDDRVMGGGDVAYFWVVPAAMGGTWNLRQQDGNAMLSLTIDQKYQQVTGSVAVDGTTHPIVSGKVRGNSVEVRYRDASQREHTLQGELDGQRLVASVNGAGTLRKYTGSRS